MLLQQVATNGRYRDLQYPHNISNKLRIPVVIGRSGIPDHKSRVRRPLEGYPVQTIVNGILNKNFNTYFQRVL